MLDVNTMNFCGFALCPLSTEIESQGLGERGEKGEAIEQEESLIAVPNTLTSESVIILPLHKMQ